ncbi:TraR/DksA family transcriptional regulator [Nitratireductor mangrovi]|uniref:TraR/DksA family transcriptional regulator n=1 Tax=Nitratireductor mangrovi TaxID=2599600 RepID=A0A5B8KU22_9HYPH|nr:TraR/DksA C4-type zinc finger protein [Nitratireductor mangrovi]QDY99078.1 TraR/DksA family transcriptional regulator [Nitratireductor mangrovi]
MKTGNAAYELADRLAERERAAGIARVQSQLSGSSGRLVCDCGETISEARRRAVPNTTKCIDCAMFEERQRRRA